MTSSPSLGGIIADAVRGNVGGDVIIGAMNVPRLQVSERLRELVSYDKFAGGVPRMLVLESQYWLDIACINAARRMGWELERIPVALEGVMPRENVARLLHALGEFKPDFILSVNLSGMDVDGLFARLFEDLRIPYVTWFVDDPRTIIGGITAFASGYSMALSWDEGYLEYLSGAGFPSVHHVPLAVDDTVFHAEPSDSWDLPPSFVGNSNIAFAEREWAYFAEKKGLMEALREAFDAGRVNRATFIQGLDQMLPADVVARVDADEKRHAELLCFVEGTRRLRYELACTLVPEGLVLRGDDDWKRHFPEAGGGVNYMRELPDYYRRCAVNVNITSLQMPTTVNQRVFDCPAAGGFLLTDAQSGLRKLFDVENEAACYSSFEECRELFRHYRTHPAARTEIACRARRRILGEHTYAHRLEKIAALVKERFG